MPISTNDMAQKGPKSINRRAGFSRVYFQQLSLCLTEPAMSFITSTAILCLFLAGPVLTMPMATPVLTMPMATPVVSPSVLEEYFQNISVALGAFPDPANMDSRVFLVNEQFDQCLTVWGTLGGNGWRVVNTGCQFGPPEAATNSLVYLKHVSKMDGYINIGLQLSKCLGTGYNAGSQVYTGDWCDSPSHQFALIPVGSAITLVQRETMKCLATVNGGAISLNLLVSANCNEYDAHQKWRVCDNTGTSCWPSVRPPVPPAQ